MTEGLKIQDASAVGLVDIHRLPQHRVYKNGKKVSRSMIVKLDSAFSKRTIFKSLNHLKEYNEDPEKNVYVTEHLSKPFYEEKRRLLPYFKQTRSERKKSMWRVVDGEYCLYVENKRIVLES